MLRWLFRFTFYILLLLLRTKFMFSLGIFHKKNSSVIFLEIDRLATHLQIADIFFFFSVVTIELNWPTVSEFCWETFNLCVLAHSRHDYVINFKL